MNDNQKEMLKAIDDFYQIDSLAGPIKNLTDLLTNTFTCNDQWETDDKGEPVPLYKVVTPEYIGNMVYMTMSTINLLVELGERWRREQ